MALPIAAIIGAAVSLGQMGYGAYQKNKAKKAYNAIPDAPYKIPQGYYDNLNLSESQAQTGWSPEATNYFTQQLQQGLSSSSNAMLQAGGGVNDFAGAYEKYTNALKSFSFEGDKLKMAKIKQLIDDRSALAREEVQQWSINKYKKMMDQKAAAALLINQGQSNINQGVNGAIKSGMQIGQYYMTETPPKETTLQKAPNNSFDFEQYPAADLNTFKGTGSEYIYGMDFGQKTGNA